MKRGDTDLTQTATETIEPSHTNKATTIGVFLTLLSSVVALGSVTKPPNGAFVVVKRIST